MKRLFVDAEGYPRLWWLYLFVALLTIGLILVAVGAIVTAAHADPYCGDGSYYDPLHQICAPYMPSKPQPGYPQTCSGGWYDPSHDICQPYPPAYPPPNYPY